MSESIYAGYEGVLQDIADDLQKRISIYSEENYEKTGLKLFEHLSCRIKSEESMREKCRRKGLPETPETALSALHDAIGLRVVCGFRDDIYANIEKIKQFENCRIVQEKDYVHHAKPNGYRSYHLILEVSWPVKDINGNTPGIFYAEVQLRTIAMDSWASLEHQLKYKKDIQNTDVIESELKRVADELASCDVSMQTIRDLIHKK